MSKFFLQKPIFKLARFLLPCKQKQKDGKAAPFPSHLIKKQEVFKLCSPLMHLQRDFAFTEDDSVNIMDADKIWRRCEKAALR